MCRPRQKKEPQETFVIKTLGLALLAAFTLAAAPIAAQAAPATPAAKLDLKIDPDAHAAGKKEAPDAVKSAGIPCTITDAYYIGSSEAKDDKGKSVTQKLYEVACQGAVGQILQYAPPAPAKHYDCFAVLSTPNIRCRLPENADLKAVLAGYVNQAGRTCTISDFRYEGGTPAGDAYYEVGCTGALGFIIKHTAANETVATDCVQAIGTNLECKLTSAEAIKAADRAAIDKLAAASGKACTIKDTRTIGKLVNGGSAYEIACSDGKSGYILMAKADGSLEHAIPCANAEGVLGGCKLTDATVSQTEEAATYTKLAKASGFNCDVAKYRFIGMDTKNNEVVELACTNRPDGGIAILPSDNSAGRILDCVRVGALGQTCRLTDPSLLYSRYTQALAAKGKTTCKVTGARWLGSYAQNHTDLVETACSDGQPGWVMELDAQNNAVELLSCGQAKAAGAQCTLPGNVK
jgi:hypothetical protein